MTAAASLLLVPVQEAEEELTAFRKRLDPTHDQGVPAHISVLVPFLPPAMLSTPVIEKLTGLFERFRAFDFDLSDIRWFENRVLWLKPEPAEPFRMMTTAVVRHFPDYPPYEGAYDEVVPHLTVGEGGRWRKRRLQMRCAASLVERRLPIRARAAEIWLMVLGGGQRRWDHVLTFPLT